MNCQHISRIVDTGKFGALTASELRDCEEHAHSCRHCAPLWTAHACIGGTSVPSMPAELSVRCLTLAAANPQPAARHASRRIMLVVGGIVALAAAAAMLAVDFFGNSPPQVLQAEVLLATPNAPADAVSHVETTAAATDADPAGVGPPAIAEAKSLSNGLPLIPAPLRQEAERKFEMDLANRKALELYPELVQGPEIDGHFVVSLTLRANGTVVRNSLVIVHGMDEVNKEMHRMQSPGQSLSASQTFTGSSKGTRMQDGRVLRGDLTLNYSFVSNSFDVSRTDARVQEIIRAERAHLMLPTRGDGVNTLTVLLSDDGSIRRESVEFNSYQQRTRAGEGSLEDGVRASGMASKLGVGVDQIGLMGFTSIEETGSDPSTSRGLFIKYAWARREGESGPKYRDSGFSRFDAVDPAAALIVVERMMPEVFLQTDRKEAGPSTSSPTFVFTVDGRFIAAGRINMQSSERPAQQIQKFAPGVQVYSGQSVSVRNASGRSMQVHFFWEATPAQKEELAKAESTRSGG